jgi:hypothetical protein
VLQADRGGDHDGGDHDRGEQLASALHRDPGLLVTHTTPSHRMPSRRSSAARTC